MTAPLTATAAAAPILTLAAYVAQPIGAWTYPGIRAAVDAMAALAVPQQVAAFVEAFPGFSVPRTGKEARQHAFGLMTNRLGSYQRCQTIAQL